MNIEGTPHEKWLLVTFSYIIGFTTSFIAFNFAFTGSEPTTTVRIQPDTQMAAAPATETVAEQEQSDTESTAPATGSDDIALVYENQGLYFYGGEEYPTLLSKDIAAVNGTYDDMPELSDRQGFHTAVPGFEYFAELNAVYYCEQYDSDTCAPMYYDVDDSSLYLIRDAEGSVALSAAVANEVNLTSDTGLTIPGYSSVDPAQPWVVAAN